MNTLADCFESISESEDRETISGFLQVHFDEFINRIQEIGYNFSIRNSRKLKGKF